MHEVLEEQQHISSLKMTSHYDIARRHHYLHPPPGPRVAMGPR